MSVPLQAPEKILSLNQDHPERSGVIVFDSGIGGFSILSEIVSQNISPEIIYLADQHNFPYGNKTEDWLTARLTQISAWAAAYKPQAFVIACNTATVAGISAMREKLDCPIVGVEPVIKPLSSYSRALVLMTHAAAASPRTAELLSLYGNHLDVYTPSGLADAIEHNENDQVKNIIAGISAKVAAGDYQALGLSCTHYPLIKDKLAESMPGIHIYDPSLPVTIRLKQILVSSSETNRPSVRYFTTGGVVRFTEQIKRYLGESASVEKVNI